MVSNCTEHFTWPVRSLDLRSGFMKSLIIGCIFAMMQVQLGIAAQEPKPAPRTAAQEPKQAMQLILSPDHITVTPDSNFELYVKWINKSNEDVDCSSSFSNHLNEIYSFDIRTNDGQPVPRVIPKPPYNGGFYTPCDVGPGQSSDFEVGCVMCVFKMRQPGVYTVQISLPDPDHPGRMLGTSNKMTVTVKAPE